MSKKLFVGNLSHDITNDELRALFAEHGNVESANVILDRYTGRSRGFGFVEMSSSDEAQAAIDALNGHEASGRKIVVNKAHDKGPRNGGPGGGGGGGGRPGGSGGDGQRRERTGSYNSNSRGGGGGGGGEGRSRY